MGLERNGFFISVVNGSGDSIHGHNAAHEGGRDAGGEISNKDVLVSDACKGGVVLEVGKILNEGWGVGVVLSFGHVLGGEPGDGIASGVMVFECGFKLCDKVKEGSHDYGGSGNGVLSKCGCPSEGGSLGHVGEGKGDHLVIGVIDFVIDEEVEAHSIQPLIRFLIRSVKGFRGSDAEFCGFQRRHG